MRLVSGILGIVGAIWTIRIGIMLSSMPSELRMPLSGVLQISMLLVVSGGVDLGLNLSLLVYRMSRTACLLLVGVGCVALICLGGIFTMIIRGVA